MDLTDRWDETRYAVGDLYVGGTGCEFIRPPSRSIQFMGPDQEVVGTLSWDDGELKFDGKADESAVVFIAYLRAAWGIGS